jgi:multiple sugar transport system substrate-binding protein
MGPYLPIGKASTYNPKTKKYFAVSDAYVPDPVVWRHDLWTGVGEEPNTWENVLKAAPKLKQVGHPIGIGQSQNDLDSNMALSGFLMCFGSFLQTANNRPDMNTKKTVAAVKFMSQIYQQGEDPAIFGWNTASNNNDLYSGHASLILNAISATRTPEQLNLPFAKDLWIWPIPAGPNGRVGLEHLMGCWSIWKFAQNKENAQKFLADLLIAGKQATIQSQLYNFPTFTKTFPFPAIRKMAAADTHPPKGKYTILTTIAEKYTHNIGYPGTVNAAVDEVLTNSLIPNMFAQVSQGKMSAEDSVAQTKAQINQIYAKWRARGKI